MGSTGYKTLLLLHLICVVGGFGAIAYNGVYLTLGRRQRGGAGPVLQANAQVSSLAELLIYGAALFGIATVGSSPHSVFKFSQAWIIAALAIYVVLLGILHGWIRPRRRRYDALVEGLARATDTPPGAKPPEIVELSRLERQVSGAWGVFNVLVLVVLYLMVFKPGVH